ncbi:MAG: STAS domain-containing protein [Flavobacteriales bacterium]|nr:STAS domain-containing protein [Flavobacteriales bacterium]
MAFNFEINTLLEYAEVKLEGKLMAKSEATNLMVAIDDLLHQKIFKFILNLEDLQYLNSSGLGCLVTILTKVRNEGGEVTLVNISDKIEQLMLITKLNSIFHVSQNIEEAIHYIKN